MANATMEKFGYPTSMVRDYDHWVVLVRPAQVTLGSLVLAAKSDARAFGDLPPAAHAELAVITAEIERTLKAAVDYERINYLMLMMVDPDVHFHIFPRYDGIRSLDGSVFPDQGWPGPPDLKSGKAIEPDQLERLKRHLAENWSLNQ